MSKNISLCLIIICFFFACVQQSNTTEIVFQKEATLKIINSAEQEIIFDVELANTDYKRERGLMYRRNMAENQGMFFDFPHSEIRSFWMKNTYLSLDLIFIDEHWNIVDIHENAFPLREDPILSKEPAKYVFEVLGGICQKMHIGVGDRVVLFLGQQPMHDRD